MNKMLKINEYLLKIKLRLLHTTLVKVKAENQYRSSFVPGYKGNNSNLQLILN